MRGIEARLRRLELEAGRPEDLEALSDGELNARIRKLCELVAVHPDSSPEDKALAEAELVKLDAEEMEAGNHEKH